MSYIPSKSQSPPTPLTHTQALCLSIYYLHTFCFFFFFPNPEALLTLVLFWLTPCWCQPLQLLDPLWKGLLLFKAQHWLSLCGMNNSLLAPPPGTACGGCTLFSSSTLNTHIYTYTHTAHSSPLCILVLKPGKYNRGQALWTCRMCAKTQLLIHIDILTLHTYRIISVWLFLSCKIDKCSMYSDKKNFQAASVLTLIQNSSYRYHCGGKVSLCPLAAAARFIILVVSGFRLVCERVWTCFLWGFERCCWPEVPLTTPGRPQAESAYTTVRADGVCRELCEHCLGTHTHWLAQTQIHALSAYCVYKQALLKMIKQRKVFFLFVCFEANVIF